MSLENIWKQSADYIKSCGWAQGRMQSGNAVCLTGALRACALEPGDWLIARAVARHRKHAESWNDNSARTKAQVIRYLNNTPEITDAELEKVFGPQFQEVIALVRRAALLTPSEAKDLYAYYAYDAYAAYAYAYAAAAADAAADAAAYAYAAAAADAAARGLAVRHLIGKHGFTQAHYNRLTYAWTKVIGPVHPEDAPVG